MVTRFDRAGPASGPAVTGFSGRGFKVDGKVFAGGIQLTPLAAAPWTPPPLAALEIKHVFMLLELYPQPEFLLLGTGASLIRPPPSFTAAVEVRGIGLEAMDSRAAARAWAVLRAEDRWIAGALMPL